MILYLGNMLSVHGKATSMLETLLPKLSEITEVKAYSNQQNKWLRLLSMMAAIIRHRNHVKIVLIDTFSTNAFWFAAIAGLVSRALKLPYVPVLRGGDFEARMIKSTSVVKAYLNNSLMNIVPSLFLKQILEKRNFKSLLIPNALEMDNYQFKCRENCSPRLLWVRSFDKIYNPWMAIEVVKQLKEKYPHTQLCMVGPDKDGSLVSVQAMAGDVGVADAVKFTGVLSKAEWIKLSMDYDIFINTTNYDNLPVSVLEAMALGLPIVSTNVGGIPFLIEDQKDGLLVDKNNATEMAAKISTILEDTRTAKKLSLNARAKAETYDWMKVRNLWFDVVHKKFA